MVQVGLVFGVSGGGGGFVEEEILSRQFKMSVNCVFG